jgi:hypothetical protein
MNWSDFVAQVERLRVTANDCTLWQLQAVSGAWFAYRAGQWVAASPNLRASNAIDAGDPDLGCVDMNSQP